jgi:protein TonB
VKISTNTFKHMSIQNRITVFVIAIHVFLVVGFQFGSQHHQSASEIGDTITASLLDPNPEKEKKTPKVPEKQKAPPPMASKSITTTNTPISQDTATPPPNPTNGSSSGDPRAVSISQAQCSVPEPNYPSLSRRMGEEGKALVRLYINESGAVEKVTLAQSSGIQRLDQAALEAGQKARCKPFMESGKAIKVTAIQPYIFRLE